MTQNIQKIQVQLYGAFRDLSSNGICVLSLSGKESVLEVKAILAEHLAQNKPTSHFDIKALLAKSALATETQVLTDTDILPDKNEGIILAILPPVCGG